MITRESWQNTWIQIVGDIINFQNAISLASWFMPGLGTYKAAKVGHKVLFASGLIGDLAILYSGYKFLSSDHTSSNKVVADFIPSSEDIRIETSDPVSQFELPPVYMSPIYEQWM